MVAAYGIEGGVQRMTRLMMAAACLVVLCACAVTDDRLRSRFEATLAADESATAALKQWCTRQDIATPALITVDHLPTDGATASADIRRMLEVDAEEPLGYRHVALVCGSTTLSVAHNWYVPGRLTADMNDILQTTNTPFGRAVADLDFTRERLESVEGPTADCPADTILTHRAILRRRDAKPISTVIECYTPANLRTAGP